MKRRLTKVLSTALSLGLILVGGVTAYFTHQASTQQIVVSTGSLAIAVDETSPVQFDNLLPSEEREVTWTVTNTGSTSVWVKGRTEGIWEDETLTEAGLLVTEVSAQVDGSWLSLASDPAGVSEEFFVSATGQEVDLMNLADGESMPMKLKFVMDSQMVDEYQNQSYGLSVHLAAKQASTDASWPSSY
ncbi:MAG: TasA family protein [Patescibacteria group bacterium]|nr:M73 family metallopeptidase [Patescibacteria group bacterium]